MRVVPLRTRVAVLAVILALNGAVVAAARLHPEAIAGWSAYVSAAETRIRRELESPRGFLVMDFLQDAADQRRSVLAGGVVIQKLEAVDSQGRRMTVNSALVHHLRGEVLIPGVTVRELLTELQTRVPKQEDVLRSTILEREPDRMRIYLRLQRQRFVTVVYDTEHTVTFTRFGNTRAASTSTATRIAEVSDPDTPQERELPLGDDRGFLWRLNAYWRYEEVAGGVIAECESISLSRDVPSVLRYLVSPVVESTARESMERTLTTLRTQLGKS
jgi:hypothetical protein